jgi:hypothetical protein
VVGETEVVVRAEKQCRLAVDDDVRPLRPTDQPGAAMETAVTEFGQSSGECAHC